MPLLSRAVGSWGRALAVAACMSAAAVAAQAHRTSTVIDATQLLADAQRLSSDDMQGRLIGSAGGIKARAFVVERFRAIGLKPFGASFESPFSFALSTGAVETGGANVVGYVEGAQTPQTFIVVSAHYDHIGVRGGRVYNGADDNASGTAALLAAAKYFTSHRPQHSIVFAAFDGEEAGLRGSAAFVAHPPVNASAMVLDVNLDMVGRDAAGKLFAVGTFLNPFLKPYIDKVAPTAPVRLLIGHDVPNQPGVEDWTKDSDHWSFQQAGIPAVYLGDEDFAEQHQPTDDYETLTFDFFIGAAETAVALVTAFDQNLEPVERRR